MDKKELIPFVNWLSKTKEFKGLTPDKIVIKLNEIFNSDNGEEKINKLIDTYRNLPSLQRGGKAKQRHYDYGLDDFHGIDIRWYGPTNRGSGVNTWHSRSLKPGTAKKTLDDGVQLRQITKNNITTSEFVSPDKKDTLYIHNGMAGRVDSNVDDSGLLGIIGLRSSTPVSNRFRYLQGRFYETFDKNK